MKIIGITGGVGCGKSEVLGWLEKNTDAAVVRADDVGRDLMRPGTACTQKIIELFGPACADDKGRLNRPWIADRVFQNKEERDALDAIIHPAVCLEIERLIFQNRACGWKWFFLESALLLEAGYQSVCDEIWYICADEETRISRLEAGRGYSREKSLQVMGNQMTDAEFRTQCSFVIDNSGDFAETARQLEAKIASMEN